MHCAESQGHVRLHSLLVGLGMTPNQTTCVQDAPLITNVGTEFQLRPVNYFDQLASLDVNENDAFEVCTPQHGNAFDYTYNTDGSNKNYNKMSYKYGG